jgi:hypothetical protein
LKGIAFLFLDECIAPQKLKFVLAFLGKVISLYPTNDRPINPEAVNEQT